MPSRTTYVALLRGINLGSRNRVSMADLRALLEDLGAEDVATYLQSGNAVFLSARSPGDEIEKRIRSELGVDVTVLMRTRAQIEKIVRGNPFANGERDVTKLHVTFLARAPARGRTGRIDADRAAPDDFRVVGREVYLRCQNGYGRSKLTNAYLEQQLDTAATTRNWKTVTALAELARA